MNIISIQYFRTPFGELILGDFKGQLCLCDWRYRKMRKAIDARIMQGLNATFEEVNTSLLDETVKQLQQYFNKERSNFEIKLKLIGTNFQKEVWEELLEIPFGKTETYLSLSQKLNKPKAIRAIASANGANAISIIVPCHRVIGSDNKLVGYAGGLEAKKKLLLLEGFKESSDQLKLF